MADNPPAFPFTYDCSNQSDIVPHEGMTLRDYFAGQALVGLASRDEYDSNHVSRTAHAAYQYADAMLAGREKQS